MENIFKVISISASRIITTPDGNTSPCRDIVLQLPGNNFSDKITGGLIGSKSELDLHPGDLVAASVRLDVEEYNGRAYQKAKIIEVIKI